MVSSTLLPESDSSSSQDATTGDLVLRVCGTSRDGQLVRLTSPKCTIGSAARCTLRLRARGVGAVHCLILRGPQGTIVRRWRSDTRLNSQAFTDAELQPGDRLSIGPIELEVVEVGRLVDIRSTQPFNAVAQPVATSSSKFSRKVVDKLAARLTLANQQGRRRAKRLVEKLRTARQEIERLGSLQSEQQTRQQQQQGEAETQLAQRVEQFQAERETWQQQQHEAEGQFAQRAEELEAKQETLQRQQREAEEQLAQRTKDVEAKQEAWQQQQRNTEELEASHETSQQQQREAEEQLAQRTADLDAKREALQQQQREAEERLAQRAEELDADRATLAEQRDMLESRQAEAQALREELDDQYEELARQRESLETLRQELNDRQIAIDAEQEAREALHQAEPPRPAAVEPEVEPEVEMASSGSAPSPAQQTQPASEGHSEELSDILRRMGRSDLLVDNDEEDDGDHDVVEPAPHAHPPGPAPTATVSLSNEPAMEENGDDESIDDYMARLLARVGGDADAVTSGPSQRHDADPDSQGASSDSEVESTTQAEPTSASDAAAQAAEHVASLTRRAAATERTSDLSAMRELAKVSAETALSSHAQRQMTKSKRTKMLVGIIALVVGVVLLGTWASGSVGSVALYAALLGLLIAAIWGFQYVVIARRLREDRTEQTAKKVPVAESGETQA